MNCSGSADAQVAFIGVVGERCLNRIVIRGQACRRQARHGQLVLEGLEVADDLLRQRIDRARRNGCVRRVHHACRRILYRNHQDTIQLVLRRQRQHAQGAHRLPEALVIEKEKELVLDDRSAEIHAELVSVKGGFLEGRNSSRIADHVRLKEARSIQIRVPKKFVQRCMELICSAGRRDIYGRARRSSILRAHVVGHYAELRHGVRRNGDDLVVEPLVALALCIVVHTVQQEIIEHAPLPVYVVRSLAHQAADGAGRGSCGRLAHARDQAQQVGVVPAHQRQSLALVTKPRSGNW